MILDRLVRHCRNCKMPTDRGAEFCRHCGRAYWPGAGQWPGWGPVLGVQGLMLLPLVALYLSDVGDWWRFAYGDVVTGALGVAAVGAFLACPRMGAWLCRRTRHWPADGEPGESDCVVCGAPLHAEDGFCGRCGAGRIQPFRSARVPARAHEGEAVMGCVAFASGSLGLIVTLDSIGQLVSPLVWNHVPGGVMVLAAESLLVILGWWRERRRVSESL